MALPDMTPVFTRCGICGEPFYWDAPHGDPNDYNGRPARCNCMVDEGYAEVDAQQVDHWLREQYSDLVDFGTA